MPTHPIPKTMKAPADKRPGWLVLQVMITRACSESCFHCSQGSNLAGRPAMMTVDEFECAVKSLHGFPGTIGVFGGQPTLHPKFPEICEVMRRHVPFKHRGLWTNALNGHGKVCRETFNPARSNLNTHTRRENFDEIERDWPEAIAARREHTEAGATTDSRHSSPWVAIQDVIPDEAERWELIGRCTVNQNWSAIIGTVPGRGLRAYLCELQYAQAAMHAEAPDAADWPDEGMPVVPGWWQLPLAMFERQVRLHCQACGLAMNRPGQGAITGEVEEFSETHRAIARPKVKARPVAFVGVEALTRSDRPATEYIKGVTPGYRGV
jgi:hypothetical protein